jgi:hypothetical protein
MEWSEWSERAERVERAERAAGALQRDCRWTIGPDKIQSGSFQLRQYTYRLEGCRCGVRLEHKGARFGVELGGGASGRLGAL